MLDDMRVGLEYSGFLLPFLNGEWKIVDGSLNGVSLLRYVTRLDEEIGDLLLLCIRKIELNCFKTMLSNRNMLFYCVNLLSLCVSNFLDNLLIAVSIIES